MNLYIILLVVCTHISVNAQETTFDQNYVSSWGGDHVNVIDQGRQVQLKIDPSSGGGFKSKLAYGSGHFKLNIKTPQRASGLVTTFYLTSAGENGQGGEHSEVDFEILGRDGPPYILHTNVFAQDNGGREQQIKLWFDPSADFHEYSLIWNPHQIAWFVDGTPVRVVKNYTKIGANYPKLPMHVHATLWNATEWLGATDWSKGPFYANFRGFTIKGCSTEDSNKIRCDSSRYVWNSPKFERLDARQERMYQDIKKTRIVYDYCKQTNATNNFPECKMDI